MLDRLQTRILSANESTGLRWAAQGWLLVKRVAHLVLIILWVTVAYLWFAYVLSSFPLTQPLAERLEGFLLELLENFGNGIISSIPGLLTVAVILFLAKAANDVAGNIFDNVHQGRSLIPGVHRDTAFATRRLVGVLIWAVGVAIAYPYLPVADSEAFKGLSVMFGFMLTLGSAGVVTQLMSGLVLIGILPWASLTLSGDGSGLPYLPLVNVFDLTQGAGIAALLMFAGCVAADNRKTLHAAIGGIAFICLSTLAARLVHAWDGVPFEFAAMMRSTLFQMLLTLFWTVTSIATMILASRRRQRDIWFGGFGLHAYSELQSIVWSS